MATNLTSKGQVTIPKPVRDHLGIGPGSAVDFKLAENGNIILEKADSTVSRKGRFANLRGAAGPGMTTDEIMALMRGEPE